MSSDKIIERIEREIGIPGLAALLATRLSPTDLQSLLLEVFHQRAQRQQPSEVLATYQSNRLVKPGSVSPAQLLAWERLAYEHLPPEFELVTLSPVCPLGTAAAVAPIDQDWVLSTIRNVEVVSDSTNVLALECAVRRRHRLLDNPKSKEVIHLATSHRLLRTQSYSNPALSSHFSALALCSAGQDQGNLRFELTSLVLHITFYLRALTAYLGPEIELRVAVVDPESADRRAFLKDRLFAPIQDEFPQVDCVFDRERDQGYYADLRFHIDATTPAGSPIELVDGGPVTWTQALLSNGKERCVISGIGSERVCTGFDT